VRPNAHSAQPAVERAAKEMRSMVEHAGFNKVEVTRTLAADQPVQLVRAHR
jgi:hypothetical protein